jgi:CheY-like chemotaxis protein
MGCLRLAAECQVDLFLLDLSMPTNRDIEIDGIEVARRLRASGHPRTPIILLSAHVPELKMPRGETAPYNAVIAKPLDIAKLHDMIGRFLDLSWQFEDAENAATPAREGEGARAALQPYLGQLRYLAGIGFIRGLKETLERAEAEAPLSAGLVATLRDMANDLRLRELAALLDDLTYETQ